MKIAFISANREKMPNPVIPLGLSYIIGATPEHHQKQMWDLCFEDQPLDYVEQKLTSFRPDIIAFSIRNIQDNNYSGIRKNLDFYVSVLKTIRRCSLSPIIMGGSGFSVLPSKIMQLLKPDFGISGEGEQSFRKLLTLIENKSQDYATVPNLFYFQGENLRKTQTDAAFIDLDTNFQAFKAGIDPRYYALTGIDSIQSKRGCIFKCTYCTYPDIEGNRSRLRPPADVVDEMFRTKALNQSVEHFFIVDSVFNYPKKHAMGICEEMIRRNFNIPWTCYINPNGFDLELAQMMAEAGCKGIEVGSDSGSDRVLKRLKKGFNTKKIMKLHELCVATGLKDCHNFILGTPGETEEDIQLTMQFIDDMGAQSIILMIWVDDNEFFNSPVDLERERFRKKIVDIVKQRSKTHSNWIVPSLNIKFDERLLPLIAKRFGKGPGWQYL